MTNFEKLVLDAPNDLYFGAEHPDDEAVAFVPSIFETEMHESAIMYANNGELVTLTRASADFKKQEMWILRRDKDGWRAELFPYPTAFGFLSPVDNRIYYRYRPEDSNYFSIYRSGFDGKWSEPQAVPGISGLEGHNGYLSIASNGNGYFHSTRAGGVGKVDIYHSIYGNDYSSAQTLGRPVNGEGRQFHPCIAPDESFLIYDSPDFKTNLGQQDLYIAFRAKEGWLAPVNLGKHINSPAGDFRASFSPDMQFMFFSSSRPSSQQAGIQNLYWVSTGFTQDLKQDLI